MGRKNIGVTTLTFQGYVTSSITWPFVLPYAICHLLLTPRWNPIFSRFWDICMQIYLGQDRDLSGTLSGSRDVTGHVTVWYPGAISYRCFIVAEFVSPAIFKIVRPQNIGVSTLTFLGHVTSSVTWPVHSQRSISYQWCPIATESVCLTVFRYSAPKPVRTHIRREWFLADRTNICTLWAKKGPLYFCL